MNPTTDTHEPPPFWPFATQAERDAYDQQNREGYAALASAHQKFIAAIEASRRGTK